MGGWGPFSPTQLSPETPGAAGSCSSHYHLVLPLTQVHAQPKVKCLLGQGQLVSEFGQFDHNSRNAKAKKCLFAEHWREPLPPEPMGVVVLFVCFC